MYRYQTVIVRSKAVLVNAQEDLSNRMADALTENARQGWEFVQALTMPDGTLAVILIFRRL